MRKEYAIKICSIRTGIPKNKHIKNMTRANPAVTLNGLLTETFLLDFAIWTIWNCHNDTA